MPIFRKAWTKLCHSIVGRKLLIENIENNGKNHLTHEFKAGEKVVCIYDFRKDFNPDVFGLSVPTYRETYTIRDIEVAYSDQMKSFGVGLRLAEIHNRQHWCIGPDGTRVLIEPLFTPAAFRPQVYESTMEIFYGILRHPEKHITGHSKLDIRCDTPKIKKGKPS
jgi:hypothetical protein